jgi:hypothetical protein
MATTTLPEGPLQHRPVLSHPRGSLQQVNAKSKTNTTDLSPTRMSHNDQSTYTTESEVLDSALNTPVPSSTLPQDSGDLDTSTDPSLDNITEAEGSEDEFEQQDMVIYKS